MQGNKKIDFYKTTFKIPQGNIIFAQVEDIAVDGEDQLLNWTPEFRIISRGSRSLNDINWNEVKDCSYANSDSILFVDDAEFQIDRECPDLMYFTPDFNADYDFAFDNLMDYFCKAVLAGKLV